MRGHPGRSEPREILPRRLTTMKGYPDRVPSSFVFMDEVCKAQGPWKRVFGPMEDCGGKTRWLNVNHPRKSLGAGRFRAEGPCQASRNVHGKRDRKLFSDATARCHHVTPNYCAAILGQRNSVSIMAQGAVKTKSKPVVPRK
jgi:hypothetical protein